MTLPDKNKSLIRSQLQKAENQVVHALYPAVEIGLLSPVNANAFPATR
jgi:hypothetical protein